MGRRTQKNPWVGVNYIPDNERMAVPPPYFLQRIHDQDAMLVIIPSRATPFAYVVARRKQFGPGISAEAIDATYSHPDTKMCVLYGCVPVCLMFRNSTGGWDPDPVIRKLQARDLWAHGGAEKVAAMLEAQEEAEKEKIRQATRDDLYNRSGDAWRSYQARTGASSIKFHEPRKPRTKAAGQQPSQTSRSTAGSGIIVTTGFSNRD